MHMRLIMYTQVADEPPLDEEFDDLGGDSLQQSHADAVAAAVEPPSSPPPERLYLCCLDFRLRQSS